MKFVLARVTKAICARPLAGLVILFLASRIFFNLLGIRFNPFFLLSPHCIELNLLQTKLLESIWYMHGQPPLFNFYVGLVVKFFPGYFIYIFQLINILTGLVHTIALYKLMVNLRISKALSFVLSFLFSVSAAAILYENWFFYTYAEIFLLTLSAYFLAEFLKNKSGNYLLFFFSAIAMLALTRSMFHVAWFLVIGFGLFVSLKNYRQQILKAMWIPLLIICIWYGKNAVLYGSFSASTWLGMSLARIAQPNDGIANKLPFSLVTEYYTFLEPSEKYVGIALLHKLWNEKNVPVENSFNYNHIDYIEANKLFKKASIKEIRNRPAKYFGNVWHAHEVFFQPTVLYWFMDKSNLRKLNVYATFCDLRLPSLLFYKFTGRHLYSNSLPALLVYVIIFIFVAYVVLMHFIGRKILTQLQFVVLVYLTFNVIYVMCVSNWMELGENNRFRFTNNPAIIVLCGFIINHFAQNRRFIKAGKYKDESEATEIR